MRTVHAPDGTLWEVDRIWLERPAWSRSPDIPSPDAGTSSGFDLVDGADDPVSFVALLVLAVLAWIAISVVIALLFPLLVVLAGIIVMFATVGLRAVSVATFAIEARSRGTRHRWRVRGLLRSHRAMRELSRSIAAGHGPTLTTVAAVQA